MGSLSSSRIRLVLADDQPLILAGLDALFSRERQFVVLQRCSSGREVVRTVRAHHPDVVLLSQDITPRGALEVLRTLKAEGLSARTILLADRPNGHRFAWAVQLGVYGVVFKTMDARAIVTCVREVVNGKRLLGRDHEAGREDPAVAASPSELGTLTRRQWQVARAAASGLSNKELATQLGLSEGTIKNHLHAIYERLGVDGRLALLLYLKENSLA
jgi:two-component system, NarL family, nitrate/nitrite response regulator NarL